MRRTANLRLAVGVKTFMYAAAGGEEISDSLVVLRIEAGDTPIRSWYIKN